MISIKDQILKYYMVFPHGRVISRRTWRDMVGKIDRYGYKVLCLSLDCGVKHIPVHRIMAMFYVPNPSGYSQINHIDGNKLNNHPDNLEWCTAKQNTQHAYDKGLAKAWNKGKTGVYNDEQLGRMKFNQPNKKPVMVYKDGNFISGYDSVRDLCNKMGFDRRTAMRVLKGEQGYNTIKGFKICYQ